MPSLAVKYRPKTFEDMTEQGTVVDIIENICKHNSPEEFKNRVFLFIGPAGIGKTSIAKLMANKLNDGRGEPIEIDAASHNGVDDIRAIIQQAQSYPLDSTYKVFIIDECHALSNSSWQASLKTIESPPARSVFIYATTNPEKIPATIISRCQVFQLSKISVTGIYDRLKYICDKENEESRGITYTDDALTYLAKYANGGMRDAITNLDKALAYSTTINMENLQKALGLPHYDEYFNLLNAYAKKDNTSIAKIVSDVYDSGVNFTKWFEGFHSFVIQVIKYILLKNINETMIPNTYEEKISKYSTAHANICLELARKLMKMNADLKKTSYLQETALTYLCFIQHPKKQ